MSWLIGLFILAYIYDFFTNNSASKTKLRRDDTSSTSSNNEKTKSLLQEETKILDVVNTRHTKELEYLVVQLTPERYLNETNLRMRNALKGVIAASRLTIQHEPKNTYDSKAIKVLLDNIKIGYIQKYNTNGKVDNFCFNQAGEWVKDINILTNKDSTLLFLSRAKKADILKSCNPLKPFGVESLWHMTHINNISSTLEYGILSHSSANRQLNPVDISNQEVQRWRSQPDPIYKRKLHDYAPTYISIRNPMLYVKKDINSQLCIIEICPSLLTSKNYLFTDGNAASRDTKFYNSLSQLNYLPWDVLNSEYWNDFTDGKRKKCSEFLIYPSIEPKFIKKIHCNSFYTRKIVMDRVSPNVEVCFSPDMFF